MDEKLYLELLKSLRSCSLSKKVIENLLINKVTSENGHGNKDLILNVMDYGFEQKHIVDGTQKGWVKITKEGLDYVNNVISSEIHSIEDSMSINEFRNSEDWEIYSEMAERLGVSVESIKQNPEIFEEYDHGLNDAELSEKLGVTTEEIRLWRETNFLPENVLKDILTLREEALSSVEGWEKAVNILADYFWNECMSLIENEEPNLTLANIIDYISENIFEQTLMSNTFRSIKGDVVNWYNTREAEFPRIIFNPTMLEYTAKYSVLYTQTPFNSVKDQTGNKEFPGRIYRYYFCHSCDDKTFCDDKFMNYRMRVEMETEKICPDCMLEKIF